MAELTLVAPPAREPLRAQLRARLADVDPGLRCLAEGILGADAPIDLLAVDASGRAVLLLIVEEGEDLAAVGLALAQRAWVEARLGDWLQLAPNLGVRPEAGVGAVLLAPSFRPETLAAVRALGPDGPALASYRCVRNGQGVAALVERLGGGATTAAARPPAPPADPPPPGPPPLAPARPAGDPAPFRTGLSEADLGLTPEEIAEFE